MKIFKLIIAQARKPNQSPSSNLEKVCWMSPQAELYSLSGFRSHEEWVMKMFPDLRQNPVEQLLFDKWIRVTYMGRELYLQIGRSSFLTRHQKEKAVEIALNNYLDEIVLDVWNGSARTIWAKQEQIFDGN